MITSSSYAQTRAVALGTRVLRDLAILTCNEVVAMSSNSKRTEASSPPIFTDSLCLHHAQMPRTRAIFVPTTTTDIQYPLRMRARSEARRGEVMSYLSLLARIRCHEINSHLINSHEINSREINSREINFSRDQFSFDQLIIFL